MESTNLEFINLGLSVLKELGALWLVCGVEPLPCGLQWGLNCNKNLSSEIVDAMSSLPTIALAVAISISCSYLC